LAVGWALAHARVDKTGCVDSTDLPTEAFQDCIWPVLTGDEDISRNDKPSTDHPVRLVAGKLGNRPVRDAGIATLCLGYEAILINSLDGPAAPAIGIAILRSFSTGGRPSCGQHPDVTRILIVLPCA